jgi:hypothetical protein
MSHRLLYLLSARHAFTNGRDRADARVAAGRVRHEGRSRAHARSNPGDVRRSSAGGELSVVTHGADGQIAELWLGSALFGLLHAENGEAVLRLESHAGGRWKLGAEELEHALISARQSLNV